MRGEPPLRPYSCRLSDEPEAPATGVNHGSGGGIGEPGLSSDQLGTAEINRRRPTGDRGRAAFGNGLLDHMSA